MIRALLITCLFHLGTLIPAHREHKVHNIVLYPEKHSWCKTTPIKQVVGHPGCEQIEVDNNVCVGACFSYSIPRTEPTAPGEVAPYCDSCQPSRVTWKHVTLKCTDGEQEKMTKRVEVIEDCSCLTCRQQESNDSGVESTSMDVPQLLNMMAQPKSNTSHSPPHIKHGDNKMGLLLKMIAGEQDDTESENQEESGEQIEALITEMKQNGVEEEELEGLAEKAEGKGQIKVDLGKLKEIMTKMETKHTPEHVQSEPENVHRHQHGHHHEGSHHKVKEEEPSVLPDPPAVAPHHVNLTLDDASHHHNPTLDVAPHHLRPAIEGSEITYLPRNSPKHHHHSHKPEE